MNNGKTQSPKNTAAWATACVITIISQAADAAWETIRGLISSWFDQGEVLFIPFADFILQVRVPAGDGKFVTKRGDDKDEVKAKALAFVGGKVLYSGQRGRRIEGVLQDDFNKSLRKGETYKGFQITGTFMSGTTINGNHLPGMREPGYVNMLQFWEAVEPLKEEYGVAVTVAANILDKDGKRHRVYQLDWKAMSDNELLLRQQSVLDDGRQATTAKEKD